MAATHVCTTVGVDVATTVVVIAHDGIAKARSAASEEVHGVSILALFLFFCCSLDFGRRREERSFGSILAGS